jgi:UDP-N-acetylglucosamine diphosphorylase / glucose-1-phosphate thymidylyltransferase / UDP-N-acetylgalactosamine diphosphorylase / glucosamine-1-phosphate N-acetyltransferase / galactosamine-1-phosphate N-acetyltransferase
MEPQKLFDLKDFRHSVIFHGCRYVWEAVDKIHSYLQSIALGKIEVGIYAGAHLIHPELISIGKGTCIEPGAYIRGPCIIGENCSIRQGAYIRGDVIIGDNCVVGHDTEVKNSLFLNGANAAHFAYLGDSILGNRVNLGAGVKCANLRLDHQEIFIHFEGKKIGTKRKKLGAIFGDDTQIGCNSVSNPGTITGKGVHCFPCLNFGGSIPEKGVIKPAQAVLVISSEEFG